MTDTTATNAPSDNATVTTLSKSWTTRMVVMIIAALGLGLWGLYDATVAYPNRGIKSSERFELDYLEQADAAAKLSSAGITNPEVELQRLTRTTVKPNDLDRARYMWLETLVVIGRLDPDYTSFPRPTLKPEEGASDARARLEYLKTKWNTQTAPKPLKAYDVVIQWGIFAIGCGLGFVMLVHMLRAAGRKYRWDPAEHRLSMPGGASFVPDDVELFDRRKWHKFIMFAQIKPDHAQLGGKELKFDLLKYAPLETWILEMEMVVSPPEEDEASEEQADAEAPVEPDPEP